MVKRGEIWLINLDPTIGREIRKPRPCVVVSPAEMNEHLRTVIVVPKASRGVMRRFDPHSPFKGRQDVSCWTRSVRWTRRVWSSGLGT